MSEIDYDHVSNRHSLEGPEAALRLLFAKGVPASLLDVGCGTGTWLKASYDAGVSEVFGIDGVDIPMENLLFPESQFQQMDFSKPIDLGRRFDVVLCLEVGEHLEKESASTLIDSLTTHSDYVIFSAACPDQPGQHHVNCQWPEYWQNLFNKRGYVCSDKVRWDLWANETIEPWYRQNMFTARYSPDEAGNEPRISDVIHPAMLTWLACDPRGRFYSENAVSIAKGRLPFTWYLTVPFRALAAKFINRVR
jgi:SAM-dependent methyltransferase